MVTVRMAILIFMGLGWQFAFEQWGNVGMGSDHYCNWVLPLAVKSVFHVFATDYDTSESNGTSVGDRYVATYKPSFSNGNTIRFATVSSNMRGFSGIAICR